MDPGSRESTRDTGRRNTEEEKKPMNSEEDIPKNDITHTTLGLTEKLEDFKKARQGRHDRHLVSNHSKRIKK